MGEVSFPAVLAGDIFLFIKLKPYISLPGALQGSLPNTSHTRLHAQLVEHHTCITEVMGSTSVEASDFFSGLSLQLLKLLHNCEDHFHFYSLSAVHICDLYHIHIIPLSSYNGYKLNSLLTCFQ